VSQPEPKDDWNAAAELLFLLEIDDTLKAAKADYDRFQEPSDKRAALGGLLVALMALINLHEPWRDAKIIAPIRELIRSFVSLDDGAVEPLLSPNKPKGRPAFQTSALVRAYAAAAAKTLMQGGQSEQDADGWVASRLREAGYERARAQRATREDGRSITPGTVRAWRKEAREAHASHPVHCTYHWLIGTPGRQWLAEPPVDRDAEPVEKAERILSVLAQVAPPAKKCS